MTESLDQAFRLLDMNRPRDAVRVAAAAVREQPQDAYAVRVLAAALYEAGDVDGALATVQRACALDPADSGAHRLRAWCHVERGEPWLARPAVEEALRIDPHDPHTYDVLARVELLSGRAKKAREAAERAVELAPSAPFAHFAVGYVAMGTGRDADAAAAFERVLAMSPHDTAAMHNLAIARGATIESTELLAHVVRLEPDSAITVRELFARLKAAVVTYLVGTWFLFFATLSVTDGLGLSAPVAVALRALVPVVTTALLVRHLRRLPEGARGLMASRIRRWLPSRRAGVPIAVAVAAIAVGLAVPATREPTGVLVWFLAIATFWGGVFLAVRDRGPRPVDRPLVGPVTPEAFAPMTRRVGAALLDGLATLVLGLFAAIAGGFAGALLSGPLLGRASDAWGYAGAIVAFVAFAVALPILTVRRCGATLGQREAGIAVVDVHDGLPLGPRRMVRRMAWWFVSWATLGMGWLPAWFRRPSLADRRTSSAVVRRGMRLDV